MSVRFSGRFTPRGTIRLSRAPVIEGDPVFLTLPSIQIVDGFTTQPLTGDPGTFVRGSILLREWLLNGEPVAGATGTTFTPSIPGDYTFRVTLLGFDGTQVSATSLPVNIQAFPPPVFTLQPSITPLSGIMGTTFTGNDGEFTGGTITLREWLINGVVIPGENGTSYESDRQGDLTYRVTVTGTGGSASATSPAVEVELDLTRFNPPVWNSSGYLGSFLEFDDVEIQLELDDPDDNIDTVEVVAGTLPAGLTVDITGLISGTLENVSETTDFDFTLRATDKTGLFADAEFEMQVQDVTSIVIWITPEGEVADTGLGGNVNVQLEANSIP